MKKFSEIKVGDEFFSTCSISEKELEEYFRFSRVKNAFLEDMQKTKQKIVSGRAILSRMEGEFTRLSQIYGNHIIFVGTDGDAEWENRSSRFLNPLYTDEALKIKFTVSAKEDINDEFGKIAINYEGTNQDGKIIVLSKKNWYRIKKTIS
ncbi:hypothetical protein Nlim_0723 [Candidatus Nitrosarchaeum limnium SFB1]|jgi:hypothetical protein|uniref:Uncharacterized protein n=1 Tax=Candidatus Nitrosarchaeum limnium SFB1 TaxID=886738 RepID=F3KJR5_9ARCH|nr:hypothetical protein Nlim_0723 [Candidatus Nitrosarchaeum limnium SFB1]